MMPRPQRPLPSFPNPKSAHRKAFYSRYAGRRVRRRTGRSDRAYDDDRRHVDGRADNDIIPDDFRIADVVVSHHSQRRRDDGGSVLLLLRHRVRSHVGMRRVRGGHVHAGSLAS